jgi:hypothetical protein
MRQPGSPALAAAKKFRQELFDDLALDLSSYYGGRAGSYGENWYPLPDNPWRSEKFDRVRRQTAEHILELQKFLKE